MGSVGIDDSHALSDEDLEALQTLLGGFQKCVVSSFVFNWLEILRRFSPYCMVALHNCWQIQQPGFAVTIDVGNNSMLSYANPTLVPLEF